MASENQTSDQHTIEMERYFNYVPERYYTVSLSLEVNSHVEKESYLSGFDVANAGFETTENRDEALKFADERSAQYVSVCVNRYTHQFDEVWGVADWKSK
jgi:hypothetical protein